MSNETPIGLEALRALSHPLRLRILEALAEGPSTSNRLARRLGESSGATSYHLRQLARHGLLEEEVSSGGRERWWKRRELGFWTPAGAASGAERQREYERLRGFILDRDHRVLAEFLSRESEYPTVWQEAALFTSTVIQISPDELVALGKKIGELLAPFAQREDAPPDARRAHVSVRALPWWLEQ